MPTYEFRCNKCGSTFELRLGLFQNHKQAKCPKCGSEETERKYSTFGTSGGSCSTRTYG